MKKTLFVALLALISLNCNAWSLKNLFNWGSKTTTTATEQVNTTTTQAAETVNAAVNEAATTVNDAAVKANEAVTTTAAKASETVATTAAKANEAVNTAAETVATATATAENATAKNYGSGAGAALKSLYTSYVNNGKKINTKDLTTYTNLLSVVANCACLKENYKDKTYMTQYGLGLIEGSLGLVSESNVDQVSTSLVNIANETVGESKVTAAANTATALSSLFSAFKN